MTRAKLTPSAHDMAHAGDRACRAPQRSASTCCCREAIELAHGRRHLTIVHGDPHDVAASRQLSEFYEELRRLAAGCEWVRVRGNAEYVTVTVGGAVADEQIALFEAAAAFRESGRLDDRRLGRAAAQLTVLEVRCDRSSL